MRIKKVSQSIPIKAKVVNSYSESEEETYSCDYVNEHKQEKLTAGTGIEITGENIINNLNANYSTHEQKIGTWVNNKPLYRKIVDVKLVNGFTEPVPYADNVAICHIVAGWIETGKVNMMIPTTDLHWYVRPYINADGLTVDQTNSDYVDKTARFIVEYTKTTD